jgi:hypothetical protein
MERHLNSTDSPVFVNLQNRKPLSVDEMYEDMSQVLLIILCMTYNVFTSLSNAAFEIRLLIQFPASKTSL